MNYKAVVTVAATVEPVTLSDAKDQLRIESDFTLDDTYINSLISSARDRVEEYCNRFFGEQQVTLVIDGAFPSGNINLPYPDLQSVDSIQYLDSDNALQTVSGSEYFADLTNQVIYLSGSWPGDAKNYRVNVTTGAPVDLEGVKAAILMIVADLYEHRTESVVGVTIANNPAVVSMLYPYRVNLGI